MVLRNADGSIDYIGVPCPEPEIQPAGAALTFLFGTRADAERWRVRMAQANGMSPDEFEVIALQPTRG